MMFSLAAKHGVEAPLRDRSRTVRARLQLPRPAVVPRPLLRGLRRAPRPQGLLRARDGVLHARARRQRRPRRAVLRPADAHRARHPDGGHHRRPARRAGTTRTSATASRRELILCFLRHLSEEDAFATLEPALPFRERVHRRRPRLRRARQPAEQVRARVREGARARPARRRARRRGRPGRVHPRGARPAPRRAHRPRRALRRGSGARRAARPRSRSR